LRIFPTRAVGKGQRDHYSLLLLTRCVPMQVSGAELVFCYGLAASGPAREGADGVEFVPRHRP
jgi:hypothetical protein